MMPARWNVDPDLLFSRNLLVYQGVLLNAVALELEGMSGEIEAWLKANAPWKDDTGEARRQLFCRVLTDSIVSIEMGHGVSYGLWLELKNSGKYAIIGPALDYWGPKIIQRVKVKLGLK